MWHNFCGWRLYCARHPAESGAGYDHGNFDCRSVEVGLQRSDGGVAGGYQHLSGIRHVEYWDAEAVHDDGSKYHEHRCDLERFRQRLQRGKLRNDHKYRSLYRTIISAKSSPGLCGGDVGGRSDQDKHSDGYDHSASGGFDCAYHRPGTHRRPSAVYGNSQEYDEHDRKLERCRQRVQWIQLRNCHLRRALYCSRYCSLPRSGLCDGHLGCGSHQIKYCLGDNKPARISNRVANDRDGSLGWQATIHGKCCEYDEYHCDVDPYGLRLQRDKLRNRHYSWPLHGPGLCTKSSAGDR